MATSDLNKKINDYIIYQIIATGSFGKVYKAAKLNFDQIYAIKVIEKKTLELNKAKSQLMHRLLDSQISVMQKCHSDYVVKLFEVIESEQKYFLILEYCDQLNLEQYMKNVKEMNQKIDQTEAILIIKQIICGLTALHNIPAIHRDLKPDNILKKRGKYKIGDLGFSKILKQPTEISQSILGTPSYMAPQIVEAKEYDTKVDIWSLGVIFYRMIYGELPYKFRAASQNHMIQVFKNPISFELQNISQNTKQFIEKCLQTNPQKRMDWQHIINHPILQSDSQIVKTTQVLFRESIVGLKVEFKEQSYQNQIKKVRPIKVYPKIQIYEDADKMILKKIKDHQKRIEQNKKEYENYTKIITTQKLKLINMFQNGVNIQSEKLCDELNQSKRLVQLRLLIIYRCMKKAEYLMKFFEKKDNVFKLPKYEEYCQYYKFEQIKVDYNIVYKKINKQYNKMSKLLNQYQNKISSIFKQTFKKFTSSKKTEQKNLMLSGIQNMDYTVEQHNKFVISYLKDKDNEFYSKIQQIKCQNKEFCIFLLTLKFYDYLARIGYKIGDDKRKAQFEYQLHQIKSRDNNSSNWPKIIKKMIQDIF